MPIPIDVFWVDGPWEGRLGILPRPRGGDWLNDEMTAWREAGVDVAISLLEPDEAAQLVLESEAAAASASGIVFRSFPIPDRGVPVSKEAVADLAADVVDALEKGERVAVHCRQGIGRSGLIAGGVLVASGVDPGTAITTVSRARGLAVPEAEEQRRWLVDFASWLASTRRTARHAKEHSHRRTRRA
jgi:protein-tyrosine phosphatase